MRTIIKKLMQLADMALLIFITVMTMGTNLLDHPANQPENDGKTG